MNDSTIAETLGFDLLANKDNDGIKYSYNNRLNSMKNKRFYVSFENVKSTENNSYINNNSNLKYNIIAPGMVCFTGEKYILMRSPEIEEYSFGSGYKSKSLFLLSIKQI